MKKRIVSVIVIVVAVVMSVVYFHEKNLNSDHTLKVSGNIEAVEIRLSFQTPGKLIERLVDEGYSVKKDQVLARLDRNELTKMKEQAQANLAQAHCDYQLQQKQSVRIANLLKDNAVPVQDNDIAQANFEAARAKLLSTERALELAEIRLNYADLTSPIDGFVTVKSADVGEVLQAGSPVFTVVDLNNIWLTNGLGEYDVMRLAGHASFETTRRFYLGVRRDLLDRARLASVAATESTFGTHLARAPLEAAGRKMPPIVSD